MTIGDFSLYISLHTLICSSTIRAGMSELLKLHNLIDARLLQQIKVIEDTYDEVLPPMVPEDATKKRKSLRKIGSNILLLCAVDYPFSAMDRGDV